MSSTIQVSNVSHEFPTKTGVLPVLENISLEVQHGSVIGIIGPSGCGKSSLLRILAGLISPASGAVLINAKPPAVACKEKHVGFAFQDDVLLPWLSVKDNILLPKRIGTPSSDNHSIDELIALVGLVEYQSYKPEHLSGGMKQRVALARALYTKPSVLLLDEPFGALDLLLRTKLVIEVSGIIRKARVTTVVVTHDVAEAVMICDRIHVLSARPGKLIRTVEVPFSRRDRALMADPTFNQKVAEIRELLMDEQ